MVTTQQLEEALNTACENMFLEYANNWLTLECMASDKHMSVNALRAMIEHGKAINNARLFPTHEQIFERVRELFNGNMNHASMHNRESLDDLILDLVQYRESLPLVAEYMKHKLL